MSHVNATEETVEKSGYGDPLIRGFTVLDNDKYDKKLFTNETCQLCERKQGKGENDLKGYLYTCVCCRSSFCIDCSEIFDKLKEELKKPKKVEMKEGSAEKKEIETIDWKDEDRLGFYDDPRSFFKKSELYCMNSCKETLGTGKYTDSNTGKKILFTGEEMRMYIRLKLGRKTHLH